MSTFGEPISAVRLCHLAFGSAEEAARPERPPPPRANKHPPRRALVREALAFPIPRRNPRYRVCFRRHRGDLHASHTAEH